MAEASPGDRELRALRLFEECLDLPREARLAFLREASLGDDELLARAARLLDIEASDVLLRPLAALPEWTDLLDDGEITSRLGPWEIADRIGAGGMGEVFRGRRSDGTFDRTVAIKRVRPGQSSREVVARFKRERRVLAALEHPNIARLIDAGADADDVPYLVMEYVEGRRIDEHCDAQALPVRQRLELFLKVCDAVHFAHRAGVIHRDLKPANILVTAGGEPKLLDFGIAGVQEANQAFEEMTLTGDSFGFMTPAYASPEQLRRAPLRAPSDQYSLGVILYQLVAGVLPHDLASLSPAEIERIVNQEDPPPPSVAIDRRVDADAGEVDARAKLRGATVATLRRSVRGDLDRIVLMALRKEPARRYATVADLAGDLRRYLDGRPVRAQRDTVIYRATRFVRRNRLAVGIAGAVIVAISSALWIAVRALGETEVARAAAEARGVEATQAQQRAEEGLADADAATDFLADMLASSDPWEMGRDVRVREVLDRSAAALDAKFATRPLIAGRIHMTLGQAYHRLGEVETGRQHAELALKILTPQLPEEDPRFRNALAILADIRKTTGAYDQALALIDRNIAINRRVHAADHPELLQCLNAKAGVLRSMSRFDEAEALFREVIAATERGSGPDSAALCQPLNNLGLLLMQIRRFEESRQYLDRTLRLHEQYQGAEHPETLIVRGNLAELAIQRREFVVAAEMLTGLLPRLRVVLGEDHQRTLAFEQLLGEALFGDGRYAEAVDIGRRVLERRQGLSGMRHPQTAVASERLASYLYRTGHLAEAEELAYEAMVVTEALSPAVDPIRALLLRAHSVALMRLGDREQATRELEQSLALLLEAGRNDADVLKACFDLADFDNKLGRPAHAVRSLQLWLKCSGEERRLGSDRALLVLLNLGTHLFNLHRRSEAEPILLEAYFTACDRFGADSPRLAVYAERLAQLYRRLRPEEEARWRARLAELQALPGVAPPAPAGSR